MLRRLLLAYLAFRISEFGVWIGLAAAAYGAGGVREATGVMVIQLLPATFAGATVGALVQRWGAARVLRRGLVLQSAGMAWCAGWLATDSTGPLRMVGYAGAVLAAAAVTTTRPACACLLPRLVGDDDALARANGAVGAADGLGMLVGPALAAALLAGPGIGAVFAVMVVLVAGAAVLTIGLPADITVTGHSTPRPPLLHELRAVLACPSARVVTGLLALVSLLVGALDLGFVVTAVDVLHLSGSAAAWLNAAFGLGMVLGGIAFGTIQRRGLARWVVGGLVLWAVVLLALCTITSAWIAAAMLAGGGLGAAAAEVAGRTLLQRIAGRERLATAFSVVESTQMAALALGTLSVGAAVQWFGPRAALVVPGAVLLAVTAAVSRAVLRSERHATDLVVATRFA